MSEWRAAAAPRLATVAGLSCWSCGAVHHRAERERAVELRMRREDFGDSGGDVGVVPSFIAAVYGPCNKDRGDLCYRWGKHLIRIMCSQRMRCQKGFLLGQLSGRRNLNYDQD